MLELTAPKAPYELELPYGLKVIEAADHRRYDRSPSGS